MRVPNATRGLKLDLRASFDAGRVQFEIRTQHRSVAANVCAQHVPNAEWCVARQRIPKRSRRVTLPAVSCDERVRVVFDSYIEGEGTAIGPELFDQRVENGRIVETGSAQQVLDAPRTDEARKFLGQTVQGAGPLNRPDNR